MKFLFRILVLFLFSAPAFSAVLLGEIRGDKFQWRTADSFNSSSDFTTTYWDLPSALPTAQAWLPGGFSGNAQQTIKLQGPDNAHFSISVVLKGIQYKSYGFDYGEDISGDATAGNADTTAFLSDYIKVTGKGIGNRRYHANDNKRIVPFTHIRPSIYIDAYEVEQKFVGNKLPDGRYQGSLYITSQYDYFPVYSTTEPSKNIKIRNTNTQKLTVQIDYHKNTLTTVNVLGSDLMQTLYSDDKSEVSGSTTYTVVVNGYMSNGISAKLKSSGDYKLRHETHESGDREIKYSAICIRGCVDTEFEFIREGEGNAGSNDKTTIRTMDYERAVAEIEVSFPDQQIRDLKQGRYSSAFTLVFELNV